MKNHKVTKVFALLLSFSLLFQQIGFAQVASTIDLSGKLSALRQSFTPEARFRPLHLRYLSYDGLNNNFKLLVDKGSNADFRASDLENASKDLLKYFFIGLALPNDTFWVNLRPDSPDQIIDPLLEQTDIGRIFLEADVELKKDTALATSPDTKEGKIYWDKLYKKAAELYGTSELTIPTLTRPWIVPDEVIISESSTSAYIYKATLKVMLEEDYLKSSSKALVGYSAYKFDDERARELNSYSTQLIKELILPKITQQINTGKKYASLRQAFYSQVLSQWFKARNSQLQTPYSRLIDSKDLSNLKSTIPFSKDTYFKQYQKSFKDGEYKFQAPVSTPTGQVIRSYFSGGCQTRIVIAFPVVGGRATDPKTGATVVSMPANRMPQAPNVAGVEVKADGNGGIAEIKAVNALSQPVASAQMVTVSAAEREERRQLATAALKGVVSDTLLDKLVNDMLDAIIKAHLSPGDPDQTLEETKKRAGNSDELLKLIAQKNRREVKEKIRILEERLKELGLTGPLALKIRRALVENYVVGVRESVSGQPAGVMLPEDAEAQRQRERKFAIEAMEGDPFISGKRLDKLVDGVLDAMIRADSIVVDDPQDIPAQQRAYFRQRVAILESGLNSLGVIGMPAAAICSTLLKRKEVVYYNRRQKAIKALEEGLTKKDKNDLRKLGMDANRLVGDMLDAIVDAHFVGEGPGYTFQEKAEKTRILKERMDQIGVTGPLALKIRRGFMEANVVGRGSSVSEETEQEPYKAAGRGATSTPYAASRKEVIDRLQGEASVREAAGKAKAAKGANEAIATSLFNKLGKTADPSERSAIHQRLAEIAKSDPEAVSKAERAFTRKKSARQTAQQGTPSFAASVSDGQAAVKTDKIEPIKLQWARQQRQELLTSVINILNLGEGFELTEAQLATYIKSDTSLDPYRIEKDLPIVIEIDGKILKGHPKVKEPPLRLFFVGRGVVKNKDLAGGFVTGVARLASSMGVKNPLCEIPYSAGKKTEFVLQDKDNWMAVAAYYGPQDLYESEFLLGKGGDRISPVRKGAEIKSEAGRADEKKIFADYTKAMLVAKVLGFSVLDGPDMMRGADDMMSLMVDTFWEAVKDYNLNAERLGLEPIDTNEVLKPTTSDRAGFSHIEWMVTSRGVVQGMITALRWINDAARNNRYSESLRSFLKNLPSGSGNFSCLIQGFGDVGSGIAKLLADDNLFGKFGFNVRGISNRNFAIYHPKGLSREFLLEARNLVEPLDDPDKFGVAELVRLKNFKSLTGATLWVPAAGLAAEDIESIRAACALAGVTVEFGDSGINNQMLYQEADILLPAAQANVINSDEQIGRLKVRMIAEGANNAVAQGYEKKLQEAGILYLPGELLNGGGIYTSKEDVRHTHTDTPAVIAKDKDYFRIHVTDEIDSLFLQRTRALLHIWGMDYNGSGSATVLDETRSVAAKIAASSQGMIRRLLAHDNPRLERLVRIDQARTHAQLPKRHSAWEFAVQMAGAETFNMDQDFWNNFSDIRSYSHAREDNSLSNFDIVRVRAALFALMRGSYLRGNKDVEKLAPVLMDIIRDETKDELVRKDAMNCLIVSLGWHSRVNRQVTAQAIALFDRMYKKYKYSNPRFKVWSEVGFFRLKGRKFLTQKKAGAASVSGQQPAQVASGEEAGQGGGYKDAGLTDPEVLTENDHDALLGFVRKGNYLSTQGAIRFSAQSDIGKFLAKRGYRRGYSFTSRATGKDYIFIHDDLQGGLFDAILAHEKDERAYEKVLRVRIQDHTIPGTVQKWGVRKSAHILAWGDGIFSAVKRYGPDISQSPIYIDLVEQIKRKSPDELNAMIKEYGPKGREEHAALRKEFGWFSEGTLNSIAAFEEMVWKRLKEEVRSRAAQADKAVAAARRDLRARMDGPFMVVMGQEPYENKRAALELLCNIPDADKDVRWAQLLKIIALSQARSVDTRLSSMAETELRMAARVKPDIGRSPAQVALDEIFSLKKKPYLMPRAIAESLQDLGITLPAAGSASSSGRSTAKEAADIPGNQRQGSSGELAMTKADIETVLNMYWPVKVTLQRIVKVYMRAKEMGLVRGDMSDVVNIFRQVIEEEEQAGAGAAGFDGRMNEDYGKDIRDAIEQRNLAAVEFRQYGYVQVPLKYEAPDPGRGRRMYEVPVQEQKLQLAPGQLDVLKKAVDKLPAPVAQLLEEKTLIFLKFTRGQTAHRSLGRKQIEIDVSLLENGEEIDLALRLWHDVMEREAIIRVLDGLGLTEAFNRTRLYPQKRETTLVEVNDKELPLSRVINILTSAIHDKLKGFEIDPSMTLEKLAAFAAASLGMSVSDGQAAAAANNVGWTIEGGAPNEAPGSAGAALSAPRNAGGIDFRALPIVTRAMADLSAGASGINMAQLKNMDLDKEWSDIEQMVSSGIAPSGERIKEYLQAASVKGELGDDVDKILACISEVLRMDEESCSASDETLKDILVVLGAARSAEELQQVFAEAA